MNFYKIHFKNYNVPPRVIYSDGTLDDWAVIKQKNTVVTIENSITFSGWDIDIVEQLPDDEESIEKTLAYARSLWAETYEKAKKRTNHNQAPRPIRAVQKRHENNILALNNSQNAPKQLWDLPVNSQKSANSKHGKQSS